MSQAFKAVLRIVGFGLIGFFLGLLLTEAYAIVLCFLFSLAAATASVIQSIERK